MQLTTEPIKEFKEICKKQYKEDLTDEQAKEYGTKLLSFIKLLYEIDVHNTKKSS